MKKLMVVGCLLMVAMADDTSLAGVQIQTAETPKVPEVIPAVAHDLKPLDVILF
jgi:hypothetical protein